ncbi:MAG: hypothetical protein C0410_12865 [Anaerolinea sp.]|nr:hypothetical protein [Anaerolinea sp.]
MPDLKFITLEVLLIIVIPLIVLYLRGKWPLKTFVICLFVIPAIWYLTYAPIHELSHALGTYIAGGKVTEIKLIPNFWEGVFAVAWIKHTVLNHPWQNLIMSGAPYVLDVVSIIAGVVVMQRNKSKNAMWVGIIFMLLSLRPTFDLVCETIGFYGGFKGDLWNIQGIIGSTILSWLLILSLELALYLLYTILKRYAGFNEKLTAKDLKIAEQHA